MATPNLTELLQEKMLLGLEQARDTQMPELILAQFKPFVEDVLDGWAGDSRAYRPSRLPRHAVRSDGRRDAGDWT